LTTGLQVAREPASRPPSAQAVPYGVTDSRGKEYSIVITPHVHLLPHDLLLLPRVYRTGGDPGESIGCILR